jgi:hypothetical protein
MTALLSLLIPSLIPTLADAVRGIIGKFTGGAGAAPQNVDEAIKMMNAETAKMQALAALDAPAPNVSKWVADLRASTRYIIAILVVINAVAVVYVPGIPTNYVDLSTTLAGSVWAFLFGERMYIKLAGRK